MHAQSIGMGPSAMLGAIETHRQAAKHGQPHAQQGLEIGNRREHRQRRGTQGNQDRSAPMIVIQPAVGHVINRSAKASARGGTTAKEPLKPLKIQSPAASGTGDASGAPERP